MYMDQIKGYWKGSDYMGWIPSEKKYKKFVNDTEYYEYFVEFELNFEEE